MEKGRDDLTRDKQHFPGLGMFLSFLSKMTARAGPEAGSETVPKAGGAGVGGRQELEFWNFSSDVTPVTPPVAQDPSRSEERGRAAGCPPILLPSTGAAARIQNTEFSQKKASMGHPQDKRPACYDFPRKAAHFWTQPLKHTTLQDCVSPKPSK